MTRICGILDYQDIIKNYPEFANFIRVYYKWNLEQGFNKIVNNSRSLLYQQVYARKSMKIVLLKILVLIL